MQMTPEYKEEISRKVAETILKAVEDGTLPEYEMATIAGYYLRESEQAATKEEINRLLSELAQRWSIFEHFATLEIGKQSELLEKEAVEGVLQLAKDGNIDQAIDLAKSATHN